jgi:hypothetical protein
MATINFATREIQAKVVYFGATGAGCTTNLEHLHASVPARRKSTLHGFGVGETAERSWFFEYAVEGPIDGFELLVRVYCLPGGIELEVHREEVMSEVDGLVLVADARVDRNRDNVDALLTLESLLKAGGLELSRMATVIQVNHTDTEQARPLSDVVFDLNPFGFPVVPAVARAGKGVLETHSELVTSLIGRLRNALAGQTPAMNLKAVHDARRQSDGDVIQSHVEAIQRRAMVTPDLDRIPVTEEASPFEPLDLPEGPEIEVPFQPRALLGSHPVDVLSADVAGDRVRVELVMERMGGSERFRLTVWMLNRPTDTPPILRSPSTLRPPEEDEVFDYIPADEDEHVALFEEVDDYPGVAYGIVGVMAGVLIGLLSAYLTGWFAR